MALSFIHSNAGAIRSVTPKIADPMISSAMNKMPTHSIVVAAGCSDLILPDELTFIPSSGNRRNNCYRVSANFAQRNTARTDFIEGGKLELRWNGVVGFPRTRILQFVPDYFPGYFS